jgi:hypothetical protein
MNLTYYLLLITYYLFSLPTIHYFFLASRFGVGYPFEKRGYSTCGLIPIITSNVHRILTVVKTT